MGWHPLQYILSFICPEWVSNLPHCVPGCKPYFKDLYERISPCGAYAFTSSSQVYVFIFQYFHLYYADKIVIWQKSCMEKTYIIGKISLDYCHLRMTKIFALYYRDYFEVLKFFSYRQNFLSHMNLTSCKVPIQNKKYRLSYW